MPVTPAHSLIIVAVNVQCTSRVAYLRLATPQYKYSFMLDIHFVCRVYELCTHETLTLQPTLVFEFQLVI